MKLPPQTIHKKIEAFFRSDVAGEHGRYRSWDHCYGYFQRIPPETIAANRDLAALQLGFYLASWGMYRPRGFLLDYTYTIHRDVIDVFIDPRFSILRDREFGAGADDLQDLKPRIVEAATLIREAYKSFAAVTKSSEASDTLVTKVLLGTFGCLPAFDRYFNSGWKDEGFKPRIPRLKDKFFEQVFGFCQENLVDLRDEQAQIERGAYGAGIRYPLMKLVDMYFFQNGFEADT